MVTSQQETALKEITVKKMSNKEVEDKAVELVLEYERKCGRNPISFGTKKRIYDIESSGRLIEVKGKAKHFGIIELQNTIEKYRNNENYYIYLVYDINNPPKTPKLKIIPKNIINNNLEELKKYKLRQKFFSNIPEEKDF